MASLLGAAYESSDDETPRTASKQMSGSINPTSIDAAPDVSIEDPMKLQLMLGGPGENSLTYNALYSDLSRPITGPQNPFKAANAPAQRNNALTGHAQEVVISDATFRAQQRTYETLGFARDATADGVGGGYVGDAAAVAKWGGRDVVQVGVDKERSKALKRKRQGKGDPSVVDGEGAYKGPWARYRDIEAERDLEAEEARAALEEAGIEEEAAVYKPMLMEGAEKKGEHGEYTEFHGTEQKDYMGRTYMHVPQDLKVDLKKEVGSVKNFVPKTLLHTWREHSKAITKLEFFPQTGHLLLSASADGKIKLYDVYHKREILRSYMGHTKAVTDVSFHPSGKTFLSTSYDRMIKLWDTETGQVISRFTSGKIPHVVRFNPSPELNHEFLTGTSDKKILQYDSRTGTIVQEYDYHLGPVNTLTFVEDNTRFVSTSDDKSLRAWEYGIPVPIKYIAEPYMFSLIRAAAHPSGKYIAFQSMDNQITVYSATNKFRQERKKSFRGHNNAGYAIGLDISPDGGIICSGDSGGWVCFWDWKSCKMWEKVKMGEGPITEIKWSPQETSLVVTGGVDGLVKMWH